MRQFIHRTPRKSAFGGDVSPDVDGGTTPPVLVGYPQPPVWMPERPADAYHVGWEAAGFQIVETLAANLVATAVDFNLWRIGDGYGGWVKSLITDAAEAMGLEVGPPSRERTGRTTRKPIPVDVRALVFARDGLACVACGGGDDLTVDHIVAVANGGTDDPDNLQTLCRPCNSSKGTK